MLMVRPLLIGDAVNQPYQQVEITQFQMRNNNNDNNKG